MLVLNFLHKTVYVSAQLYLPIYVEFLQLLHLYYPQMHPTQPSKINDTDY